ncbi:MAG: sulfatase [Acidobacteriota bacterium]|nr:sulfatase [Acidobacteriota bacterium]
MAVLISTLAKALRFSILLLSSGLVVLIGLGLGGCRPGAPGRPRLVVLITVDTLRADHLGAYGSRLALTPALDQMAREGARIETAWAPFGRTTQSVGSLLTGLHPLRHGADGLGMRLPDTVTTLPEIFSRAGYRTAAFVSNVQLRRGRGFEQGCDLYSNPQARWGSNSAAAITAEALTWVRAQREDSSPLFLWVHYLDPHWPYTPEEEFGTVTVDLQAGKDFDLFDAVRSGRLTKGQVIFDADSILSHEEIEKVAQLYQAEVAGTDRAIGGLLAGLKATGLMGDGIVLMTADHGEAMGAHDYWFAHGEYLYDDTLKVPFLVHAPHRVPAGTLIRGNVSLEDVAPTLLDLAGLAPPPDIDGMSLADMLRSGGVHQVVSRPLVHLTDHNLVHPENPRRPVSGRAGRWWALREGSWKLIRMPLGGGQVREELYDLAEDPEESHNLLAEQSVRAQRMRRTLEGIAQEWLQLRAPSTDEPVDLEQIETLRSLGYVD